MSSEWKWPKYDEEHPFRPIERGTLSNENTLKNIAQRLSDLMDMTGKDQQALADACTRAGIRRVKTRQTMARYLSHPEEITREMADVLCRELGASYEYLRCETFDRMGGSESAPTLYAKLTAEQQQIIVAIMRDMVAANNLKKIVTGL